MSFSSIYVGLSGVNANANELSVVGSNIANMNTVAFKSSRARFADLVRNALGGGKTDSVGSGVKALAPQLSFVQGAMRESSNPMDWAIDGNGFFVVKNKAGENYYTRDGQFRLDVMNSTTYRVANAGGEVLQGYTADSKGAIGTQFADLTLPAVLAAKATTTSSLRVNLEASAPIRAATFNPLDSSTYNYSASQIIYDSRTSVTDVSHTLVTYFAKTADNTWQTYFQVDGGTVATGGQLVFDKTGKLTSGTTQTASLTIPITPPVTVPPTAPSTLTQSIAVDMTGTTQYGGPSLLLSQQQDGYNRGTLQSISLTDTGVMMGRYSNQVPQTVGQLGLAAFMAPLDLTQDGAGRFSASDKSGPATIVMPGPASSTSTTSTTSTTTSTTSKASSLSVGVVRSNMLEQSNVNLSEDFMNVIIAQRAFEANSKVIMTADAIVQVIENLKR
ncbi:MAG: flagellar hook protein FlgE [Nitrospirae bacterium]|nr:MAG: flagellar hook protein FlgE [Nitrospirota bacterium]